MRARGVLPSARGPVIRLAPHFYNTLDDVDTALDVLASYPLAHGVTAHVHRDAPRETFASRFGTLMTIVGVAIGLGNVWRFPYMVGKFGGAAFVLFYISSRSSSACRRLMAEFALGRYSRRGPVGAFAAGGLPFGTAVGWFFFVVVTAATGYYTAVIGWVFYYAVGQLAAGVHMPLDVVGGAAARPRVRR